MHCVMWVMAGLGRPLCSKSRATVAGILRAGELWAWKAEYDGSRLSEPDSCRDTPTAGSGEATHTSSRILLLRS